MGEVLKISSENCLEKLLIFILGDKILKEQVLTVFKYLKAFQSENIKVSVDSEDIFWMNEHTSIGVKCGFILRPCILGMRTEQQRFLLLYKVITLLTLHISKLLGRVGNRRLCMGAGGREREGRRERGRNG